MTPSGLGTLGNDARGHYSSWLTTDLRYGMRLRPIWRSNDSIIVVVDRFSKYATFIAAPTDCTAEETARLFLKHVVKYWGLPKFIISDRNSRFTGKFWMELFKLMEATSHGVQSQRHGACQAPPQQFKSLRSVHKGLVRRYEGPFPILGKVGKVSYRVELPRRLKIHPSSTRLPESEASWELADAYGSSKSKLSDFGQKAQRERLRLRWGRVSQADSNEPPMGLYRARKLLETPRVGRMWKVLEKPGGIYQFYTMVESMREVQGFLENSKSLLYILVHRLVHRLVPRMM
ncbi:hypothetical protein CK203_027943 [Vitis vinifera]|uniref:Tf2-1-like SH3-like domain-containing protein n=1 Tax=Vitis vinifera TaxID=29760 RepID=A0A438J3N3_VITVI|nr:hypothetical protein CK203_027943 [Vitis vinifera]